IRAAAGRPGTARLAVATAQYENDGCLPVHPHPRGTPRHDGGRRRTGRALCDAEEGEAAGRPALDILTPSPLLGPATGS
ncbi:hypothetical protein ABT317_44050, partial [Streptomyces carpinensis]